MARAKGLPKTGGRQKGIPNKSTTLLKESFDDLNFDIPSKIISTLNQITPSEQVQVLLKLLDYVYPKMGAIERVQVQAESSIVLNYKIDLDESDRNL